MAFYGGHDGCWIECSGPVKFFVIALPIPCEDDGISHLGLMLRGGPEHGHTFGCANPFVKVAPTHKSGFILLRLTVTCPGAWAPSISMGVMLTSQCDELIDGKDQEVGEVMWSMTIMLVWGVIAASKAAMICCGSFNGNGTEPR